MTFIGQIRVMTRAELPRGNDAPGLNYPIPSATEAVVMTTSLFAFNFRLGPWESCINLNFDQVQLAPGFGAVCTRDQLGILWSGDPQQFDRARETVNALARTLIHADAFCSFPDGLVLEVEPVTWLEIRDCQPTGVVSGYMHQTLATAPLDPNHPDKMRLCSAAALADALHQVATLQLALADFYTARRELGPYSAFYAFRVLEDIGFHFGVTKDDKPDWDAMNTALGTVKTKWDPLTEAGKLARHLSERKLPKLVADNRNQLLGLAHEALAVALKQWQITQAAG